MSEENNNSIKLSKDGYKGLLDKFNKLEKKNKEKKNLGVHDYSLINALLKKNREVELHSNFIYSMINPSSTHYCGNIFLKFFLESINEANFLNLANARVHKEKGKIDLLIEDGEKVIIIENKLSAVDQQHQISRYIRYARETYLDEGKDCLEDKIRIVYLSEYKKFPSPDKKSCIGFKDLNENSIELVWKNKEVDFAVNDNFDLPEGTKLKFNRVQHSQHLLKWIDLSKEWLQVHRPHNVSRSLDYAFGEYKLILKRLDTKKQWRNLMSLDEYTKGLGEDEEKMYAFMCEASATLNNYLATKLFKEIKELFPEDDREPFISKDDKEFKEFNEENCKNWFNKKGTKETYRDIGFKIKINGEFFVFALGIENISYGKSINNAYEWVKKGSRKELQKNENGGLFKVLNDLNNLKIF